MAGNLSRRPQVETDLEEIWLFIASDNIGAADRLLDRIGNTFQMIAENPQAGRHRPELGMGIRSFAVGHYVVFYEAFPNGVEIVRVLHGARDIAPNDLD
ncbi:type II toxin-antitoxin system RelE/ParE family toxin [Bradyrhizobium betae]|uniref:Type II toxin-antitoxin system RelE/ParE family toxin n=1 Tax=Bradyrhizobium betae TaxID=244734 RepID=A0A5P6P9F1_9BRAD|nr:type II toxin-antitoxin system RelE/ParE family toxin [Bradyrhizobium betae]MCS3729201.1 toxin ParE1/3/4 [Bradyrhizobium betae]QFI74544.1 type II toxin-antitoxin system RelE/ParE family toxin [Bradyrhizobium betae]